jgi:hypothetical protein
MNNIDNISNIADVVDTDSSPFILDETSEENNYPSQISLWECITLYKIGNIPIIEFAIGYLLLYFINHYFLKCNYKIILIVIPFVILLNIAFNKSTKPSWFLIIILLITLYFLIKIEK